MTRTREWKKFPNAGTVLIKAESTFISPFVCSTCENVWIAGIFQRVTQRLRKQVTDNKQGGDSFSVIYN